MVSIPLVLMGTGAWSWFEAAVERNWQDKLAQPADSPEGGPRTASSPQETAPSRRASARPTPVKAGEITHFAIPAAKVDASGATMAVGNTGVIRPPEYHLVYRVTDKGVKPATKAKDTVYLACHTHSRRTAKSVPCNNVPTKAEKGQQMVVTTTKGTLYYTIDSVRRINKNALAQDQQVGAVKPGRLGLITCDFPPGNPGDDNVVVIAHLRR